MGLPPEYCPTRCAGGVGRQRVAVVRNPFKRLVELFSAWLEPYSAHLELMGQSFRTWRDFPRWVAGLSTWMDGVAKRQCEGNADDSEVDTWRHLLPTVFALQGWPSCEHHTARE